MHLMSTTKRTSVFLQRPRDGRCFVGEVTAYKNRLGHSIRLDVILKLTSKRWFERGLSGSRKRYRAFIRSTQWKEATLRPLHLVTRWAQVHVGRTARLSAA